MKAAHKKIARNTLILGATELLSRIMSLALIILVARHLGPALMGIYAFGLTFVRLLEILVNFGLDRYIQREIGRRPARSGPLFSQVFGLKLAVYLVGAAVVVLLGHFIITDPLKRWVVWLLSLTIFFRSQSSSTNAFFRARQQAGYESVVVITQRLAYTSAGVAAILAGQGLLTLVTIELLAQIGACATGWWLFWRKIGNPFHRVHIRELKALAGSAKDFLLIRLALSVFGSVDVLLLSFLAGDAVTGWYAAAMRWYAAVDFVPDAFSGAFAILGGLAPQCVRVVFGAAFQPAAPTLMLLAPALVLNFINLTISTAIIALDEEHKILVNFSLAALLNITLNFLFIPLWQQNGAALATLLSEAAVLVLQLRTMGWPRLRSMGLSGLIRRPLTAGLISFSVAVLLVAWDAPFLINLSLTGLVYLNLLLFTGALSWKEVLAVKEMFWRPKEAITTA